MARKVMTYDLSEPLGGARTVKIDIDNGDGNLVVDSLTSGEPLLASGELQYLENQGLPTRSLKTSGAQDTLTLRATGKGQPWFRLPWAACNGATVWQIHLHPAVELDITAHSGGGNFRLDLSRLSITRVTAATGGGNMEVILPDTAANLSVVAGTGAGNVVIEIPGDIAARVHATSGLGKVMVAPRFVKMDDKTYQSPDFDLAARRIEITASSGAGNVSVKERTAQLEAVASRA